MKRRIPRGQDGSGLGSPAAFHQFSEDVVGRVAAVLEFRLMRPATGCPCLALLFLCLLGDRERVGWVHELFLKVLLGRGLFVLGFLVTGLVILGFQLLCLGLAFILRIIGDRGGLAWLSGWALGITEGGDGERIAAANNRGLVDRWVGVVAAEPRVDVFGGNIVRRGFGLGLSHFRGCSRGGRRRKCRG